MSEEYGIYQTYLGQLVVQAGPGSRQACQLLQGLKTRSLSLAQQQMMHDTVILDTQLLPRRMAY